MTHTSTKTQVQRSVGSKDKTGNKRTDGRADAAECFNLTGGAENAGVENAGVEEAGVDRTGGICRSGKYRS